MVSPSFRLNSPTSINIINTNPLRNDRMLTYLDNPSLRCFSKVTLDYSKLTSRTKHQVDEMTQELITPSLKTLAHQIPHSERREPNSQNFSPTSPPHVHRGIQVHKNTKTHTDILTHAHTGKDTQTYTQNKCKSMF